MAPDPQLPSSRAGDDVPADGPPRRRYVSPARAATAAATRRLIVDAAADLFSQRGYSATTLSAIAAAAGVSVQSVHLAGPKSSLLIAAFGVTFIGDEGQQPLTDRPELVQIMAMPAPQALAAYAEFLTQAHERSAGIWHAMRTAAETDAEVAALVASLEGRRHADLERAVGWAASRDLLRGDAPTAERVEVMSWLAAPETYSWFVRERGWSGPRYARWLARSIEALVFGGPPAAAGS